MINKILGFVLILLGIWIMGSSYLFMMNNEKIGAGLILLSGVSASTFGYAIMIGEKDGKV